jgi:hypothetical protein
MASGSVGRRRAILLAATVVAIVVGVIAVRVRPRNAVHAGSTPRLIVLLVIDQMRADYLDRYRAEFVGGFKRLLEGGAVFTEARIPYARTETAQGHALMLSGQPPSVTGIVSDVWYDRAAKAAIVATESTDHPLLDSGAVGGSPEQMLVHTLGDVLKARDRRSMVLSVSWKRYAAILMGGQHPDAAFWFDSATGGFVTSSYYMTTYPYWAAACHNRDLTAPYFGQVWLGHRLGEGAAPNGPYRTALRASPFADAILLGCASALLEGSGVGTDDLVDVFAVSFSALDYVGHVYGPEAPESEDALRVVDRQLGVLLNTLDRRVGPNAYSLALVGDHGVALLPEHVIAQGAEGGRLEPKAFRSAAVTALAMRFKDADRLIASFEPPEFYLDYAEGQRRGISPVDLEEAVAAVARRQPGVAQAYTRSQILAAEGSNDPILHTVARSFYPARSGDVYVVVRPNFIFWRATGTTHGTPYDYDAHVPLIFYGRGFRRAVVPTPVDMRDLAPTLARVAGIDMRGAPGHVLEQAFDGGQGRPQR